MKKDPRDAKIERLEMKLKIALTEVEVLKRALVEKDELIDDYRAEAWNAQFRD